jgi:hypothetical protein
MRPASDETKAMRQARVHARACFVCRSLFVLDRPTCPAGFGLRVFLGRPAPRSFCRVCCVLPGPGRLAPARSVCRGLPDFAAAFSILPRPSAFWLRSSFRTFRGRVADSASCADSRAAQTSCNNCARPFHPTVAIRYAERCGCRSKGRPREWGEGSDLNRLTWNCTVRSVGGRGGRTLDGCDCNERR